MLYVISGGSFNLATLDKVELCKPPIRRRPTEATRQFIERAMRENHGYTVPQHWLADLDVIPDGDTGEPQSGYLVGVDTPTAQEAALLQNLAGELGDAPATTNPAKTSSAKAESNKRTDRRLRRDGGRAMTIALPSMPRTPSVR